MFGMFLEMVLNFFTYLQFVLELKGIRGTLTFVIGPVLGMI